MHNIGPPQRERHRRAQDSPNGLAQLTIRPMPERHTPLQPPRSCLTNGQPQSHAGDAARLTTNAVPRTAPSYGTGNKPVPHGTDKRPCAAHEHARWRPTGDAKERIWDGGGNGAAEVHMAPAARPGPERAHGRRRPESPGSHRSLTNWQRTRRRYRDPIRENSPKPGTPLRRTRMRSKGLSHSAALRVTHKPHGVSAGQRTTRRTS